MAERRHARHSKRERDRLRRRRTILFALLGGTALAVGAGISLLRGDGAPPIAAGSAEQLALGADVFAANCATCHGEALSGGLAGPPLVDELYRPDHHPDDAIRSAIRNGVRPHHWDFAGMPPIRGLDEEEVEAVIAYIRDVQDTAWAQEPPDS